MEFKIFLVLPLFWALVDTCVTPLGRDSECVSLYDCPELLSAFEHRPLASAVISFLKRSSCGFEGYVPRVCCGPLPVQNDSPISTQRPRPTTTESNSNEVDPIEEEDSYPAPKKKCGIDTNGDRIYGGQFTDLDEFPWMALLGYRTSSGKISYQCGGVLINHRYVLTAAHCITGAIEQQLGKFFKMLSRRAAASASSAVWQHYHRKEFLCERPRSNRGLLAAVIMRVTVRLGEYDTQTDIDCSDGVCADPPQNIAVQSAYPHSGYSENNKNRRDDIGLVRLARRAKYSYYVQPICLIGNERLSDGSDVYVAGWGKTENGRSSPVKLKLSLPTFNKNQCAQKYRPLGAELIDKQICAGGSYHEDACRGDSGGPLMRKKPDGVWESVGVVSFGYGCGNAGWPGVYTSVAAYNDWIKSKLVETNS